MVIINGAVTVRNQNTNLKLKKKGKKELRPLVNNFPFSTL